MSVPPTVWPPLHRLPIVLLVVLAGCRSATAPAPAPPPPAPPPPAAAPVVIDVVEETRRAEEVLETVEVETAPIDAPMPAETPDPAGDPCPAAPADPPDPPLVETEKWVAGWPDRRGDPPVPPKPVT